MAFLALINALAFVHALDLLDTNMYPVLESVYYDLKTVNSEYAKDRLYLETRNVWCDRGRDLISSFTTGRPVKFRLCQTVDCPERIAEERTPMSITVNYNSTWGNNLIGHFCKDTYERDSVTLGDRFERIWTFELKSGTKNIYYLATQPWDKKLWVHSYRGYVSFGLQADLSKGIGGRWIEFQFLRR